MQNNPLQNQENIPEYNVIYRKNVDGTEIINSPSSYLIDYLEGQGVALPPGFINPAFDKEEDPS